MVLAAVLGVFGGVIATTGVAEAGKKRVVVLDFEGPKSGKFHDELVRLLKQSQTVISTDKWNGTAEELDAADVSDKNVKKVAKKLKVDAVVEGKIEKRRDEYIIRLKLRSGVSGAVGTSVDTKSEGTKIDGRAQREIKEELIDAIASTGGGGGGDDDDAEPVAKKAGKKKPADDDDDKPVKKAGKKVAAADDDDDKPAKHGGFAKHFSDDDRPTKSGKPALADDDDKPVKKADAKKPADDDDAKPVKKADAAKVDKKPVDDDALPPKKVDKKPVDDDALPPKKKPGKKVAVAVADDDDDQHRPAKKRAAVHDDDGNEVEAVGSRAPLDRATALSPSERAVDVAIGLSVNVRRLSYKLRPDLRAKPPNYAGVAASGYAGEVTVFPLAIGHTRDDVLKDLGLTLEGSRAIKINSRVVTATTAETVHSFDSRFGIGAVFRFAFGQSPTAPVLTGGLMYTDQRFSITAESAHNTTGVPNVRYKMIEPNVTFKLPITPKIIASFDGRIMAMLDTGQQQSIVYFGTTKVTGYEGTLGVDYHVTPNIFARVEGHLEAINLQYQGNGYGAYNRDNDPSNIDVMSARDVYFGGFATVGYAY